MSVFIYGTIPVSTATYMISKLIEERTCIVQRGRRWGYNRPRKAWCLWDGRFNIRAVVRRRKRGWYLAVEPNLHTVYVFPTLEGAMLAAELIL